MTIRALTLCSFIKLSASGELIWRYRVQNSPQNFTRGCLLENQDGTLTTITSAFTGYMPYQGAIYRRDYSSDGVLLKTNTYFGNTLTNIYSAALMPDGGVAMVGKTFNYSQASLTAPGDSMQFIALRTDANGNELWKKIWGSPVSIDQLSSVAVGSDSAIYVGGYNVTPVKGGYVAKIVENVSDVNESINHQSELAVSPNPASEHFFVSAPAGAAIAVRDVFGRLLYAGASGEISSVGWTAGVYFVESASGDRKYIEKLIIRR